MHQYKIIGENVYFWLASNDTKGSGNDGASPAYDVRLAGDGAGAAPIFSGTPTLLTHANYPPGAYELLVPATVGNGFVAGNTYAVFCTLLVDLQNPTGFFGAFTLGPVLTELSFPTTELASVPTTASELGKQVQFNFEYIRNKKTVSASTETLMKEDAVTPLGTAALNKTASLYTKNEMS